MDSILMQMIVAKTLPVPSDYMASETVRWLFTIWAGGFALLVLPWALYRQISKHDSVPILVWLGGFIASLNEGTIDYNLHLWWPTNLPGPAYQTFGLNVPLLIPFCYAFFVSMTGYFAYRMMERGLTLKGVFYVWIAVAMIDVLMEYPGTLSQAYIYYGDQPFKFGGFPWWQAWTNATGFVMLGFLLWLFVPILRGWKKAVIILLPALGFHGAWGAVAWPNYMAMNFEGPFEIPVIGQWLLSAFSLGICLIVVRGVAAVVAKGAPLALKDHSAADRSA